MPPRDNTLTSGYTSTTSIVRSSRASTTEPACLTFGVLQEITDNFSEERVLGQGTYGKVYKGILENGEEIAVKMLHNNMQGIDDKKFKHEFDNLMMLDHKNTVRLVAYCYETRRQHTEFKGERVFGETTYKALCFEYMHMGSLQRHLYDESQGLDWQTRYKIIKGTCEGLKYLHEGFKEPIYHLDLKPDNILLDKNMVPKLADFGMSKLFRDEQTRVTQSPIGTIGYLPPEYLFGHVVSKKLDIFSLGVIITKIIAGPSGQTRSVEMPSHEFLHQVNDNWRNRLEATCTPQTLEANCIQVSMCTEIGLRCMDMDRKQRPTIMDIIDKLDITETIVQKGGKFNSTISKAHRGVEEDYHPNQQSNPTTRNRRRSSLFEFEARFPSLAETELAPTIVPSASPIRKPVELDLPSHKSTGGKLLNGDLLVNKEGLRIVTQSEKYERPGVGTTDVRSWEPWRREVLPDPQPPIRFGLLSIDDLDAIKVIGKGSSGNVQLVRHKWTGQFFALKVLSKHALFGALHLWFLVTSSYTK
uniref:Uncharacterized protein n=2 Tax=Avena sativa TaxID=4498 RepID=A0ACD5ZKF4_AVESA